MEHLDALTAADRCSVQVGYVRPKRDDAPGHGNTEAEPPWLQTYLAESSIALDGDDIELRYEEPRPRSARITIRPTEAGVLYGVETGASVDHVTVKDGEPLRVKEEIDGVHYHTRIWTGDA